MTMDKKLTFWLEIVAVLACTCAAWSQAAIGAQPAAPAAPATKAGAVDKKAATEFASRTPRYELRPGDVIDLGFAFTPEFNQSVTVQPDGFITLRGAGELHVQGKTVPQLTELLKKQYADVLHDPVISVVLKDFEKPHFVVTGEVGRPGKYELRADTTVMEALGIAGGMNDRAKHSQVLLFRRVSEDWTEVKELNLKKLYAGGYREDIHLRPGDLVFVPQNRLSKIKPFLPTSAVSTYAGPVR
jgi:polysaccharide biosynthesis/export protein